MGFSGDFVLARSARPLQELEWFASGCEGGHSDCLRPCGPRAEGWQAVQVSHGVGDGSLTALRALVQTTGAPVLIAKVMDSDVCQVHGLAPSGARWSTFLDPVMAADYGIPVPITDAAEQIAGWAAEAGFGADRTVLGEVLTKRADPFVEDLVFELIDACGFPPVVPEGPSVDRKMDDHGSGVVREH